MTSAKLRSYLKGCGLTVKELACRKVDGKPIVSERHLFYCLAGKRKMSRALWHMLQSLSDKRE